MAADIVAQLPQLEAMASVLYNSQVGAAARCRLRRAHGCAAWAVASIPATAACCPACCVRTHAPPQPVCQHPRHTCQQVLSLLPSRCPRSGLRLSRCCACLPLRRSMCRTARCGRQCSFPSPPAARLFPAACSGCWSMAGFAAAGAVANGAARPRCYVPCQPAAAAAGRRPASCGHCAFSNPIRPHIRALQAILDSSSSPYAQLLASSSLIKIVTEHSMSTQVRTWLVDQTGTPLRGRVESGPAEPRPELPCMRVHALQRVPWVQLHACCRSLHVCSSLRACLPLPACLLSNALVHRRI